MAKGLSTNLLGRLVLPQEWAVKADQDRTDNFLWPFHGVRRADGTLAPAEIMGTFVQDGEVQVVLRSVVNGSLSKSVALAWLRIEQP